jgi:hypothetical protein
MMMSKFRGNVLPRLLPSLSGTAAPVPLPPDFDEHLKSIGFR